MFGTDNSSKEASIAGLIANHTAKVRIESKIIIFMYFMEGLVKV